MNKIQLCSKLLSDVEECDNAMRGAVNNYPISAQQHLSKTQGKRPWLGQAACCYALQATEEETRIAWNFYMNKEAQDQANAIADAVANDWENGNA